MMVEAAGLEPAGPFPQVFIGNHLEHRTSPCGLFAERNSDNPLHILARRWPQLSPELQAALRALVAALRQEDRKGKKTTAGWQTRRNEAHVL